jgi:sugar/nucleoside kinase (ribokinase family)
VVAAAAQAEWKNVSVVTAPRPMRKLRFVDGDFTRKLFEVYSSEGLDLNDAERMWFRDRLDRAIVSCDCLVVLDFGHGLMEAGDRESVRDAKFVAVNAQTNAGNAGFNPISNYPGADYVAIDLPEARFAVGVRDMSAAAAGALLRKQNPGWGRLAITHGKNGSFVCQPCGGTAVPAFSVAASDTMGAGDAFLAVSAPLVCAGLPVEAAAFAGNVAGAIKCGIVGHRRHVERGELMQTIEALLA